MGTILDKIVEQKKVEVAELYETYSPVKEKRKTHSLVKALEQFTVIAEVKRAYSHQKAILTYTLMSKTSENI